MYGLDRDHPVIENLQATGTPDGKPEKHPKCPVCGEECDYVYKDCNGDVVGCDICLTKQDAWENDECFQDNDM